MPRIRIVTDSASDILPEQANRYAIEVIPLNVNFGDDVFKDGVDITASQFYTRLKASASIPHTSQPSAGEFMEFYQKIGRDADAIIGVYISNRLSGTIASAEAARGLVDVRVINIDGLSASQGTARLAILAAQAASAGLGVDEVVKAVELARTKAMTIFSVDTLEYLQKNGRIGRAQSMLGSLLQLKPLLHIDADGVIAPLDRVRTRSRVIPRLIEEAHARFPLGSRVEITVIEADAADRARELMELAMQGYDVADAAIATIGPVIGSHVGPGTLGLVMIPHFEF